MKRFVLLLAFCCAVAGRILPQLNRQSMHGGGDATEVNTIGTGLSQATLEADETVLFQHAVDSGFAVMNHFWAAGSPEVEMAVFRYYIDDEASASIEFTPGLACGVGFDDQSAPWGTKWFGKGAKSTGWFHNIRIPFKSIRITFHLPASTAISGTDSPRIWTIVRGIENLPVQIGEYTLPPTARMTLQRNTTTLAPLDFYNIANLPAGHRGLVFLTNLQVDSGNLNAMEGCVHFYPKDSMEWPGVLLSTGTEDYYDSAFYFDGGPFHMPVSGISHLDKSGKWAAYRVHDMDLLMFSDGVRLEWRNGDVTDPQTGLKCTLRSGGSRVGEPQPSNVTSYAWVYTW